MYFTDYTYDFGRRGYKICPFVENEQIKIKKPESIMKSSLETVKKSESGEWSYPFKTELDMKNFLNNSSIIEDTFKEFMNPDEFKNIYIGGKQSIKPSHKKLYKNGSIKIEQEFENEINKGFLKFLCKKSFYDILTEFINSEKIFNDNDPKYNVRFQYLINTFFTLLIEKYKKYKQLNSDDILFVYKGGTTMKILYNEYKDILEQYGNFLSNIKDSFKRSDSDYTILINPSFEEEVFDQHYINISKLILSGLLKLRKIIIDNEIFFLNFSRINEEDLKNLINILNKNLQEIKKNNECGYFLNMKEIIGISTENKKVFLESLPNNFDVELLKVNDKDELIESDRINEKITKFITDKEIDSKRNDFYITKRDNYDLKTPIYIEKIKKDSPNSLYLSTNETTNIKTAKYNDAINTFLLTRLKYNFILYYKTNNDKYGFFNCPAELIDISCSKIESYDLKSMYENKMLRKKLALYSYDYINDKNNIINVNYFGLTISGFIHDLIKVLFVDYKRPWLALKYEKRIYRILFFIILELISKNKFNNEIITNISNYFKSKKSNSTESSDPLYNDIIKKLEDTQTQMVIQMFNEIKIESSEKDKNDEFIDIILSILNNFTNTQNVKNKNILTNINTTEGIKIHHLGGYDIMRKYLKYITKNNIL